MVVKASVSIEEAGMSSVSARRVRIDCMISRDDVIAQAINGSEHDRNRSTDAEQTQQQIRTDDVTRREAHSAVK